MGQADERAKHKVTFNDSRQKGVRSSLRRARCLAHPHVGEDAVFRADLCNFWLSREISTPSAAFYPSHVTRGRSGSALCTASRKGGRHAPLWG